MCRSIVRTRRRPADRLALLAALLLTACGSEVVVLFDLVAELPIAAVLVEPRRIDPSLPEAGAYLGRGFSVVEERAPGEPGYRWSDGPVSVLRLPIVAPRDLELRLRLRPFGNPEAPPQRLEVSLNGHALEEVVLGPEDQGYSLELPGERQEVGWNEVEFRYAWLATPEEAVDRDGAPRRLAVAWYAIELGARQAAPHQRPRLEEDGEVILPLGSILRFHHRLPPASRLELEALHVDPGVALEVSMRPDGGERRRLLEPAVESGRWTLPLTVEEEIIRLTLRAVPAGEAWEPGSVRFKARIVGPSVTVAPPEAAGRSVERQPEPPLNLIVYLIDTLRADHLGCYGYPLPVSPSIDAFAAESLLFENALAQSSWTRSAVASLLTGMSPLAHGVNGRRDKLSAGALTMAELLSAHGYRTSAIVTNPNITPTFGFEQGFDDFRVIKKHTASRTVTRAALDWLAGREEPFFLYLHTLDPHDPYDPPEEFRARFAPGVSRERARRSGETVDALRSGRRQPDAEVIAELTALYDAEIASNDRQFGHLLRALESTGLAERTVVLLLSDHGEEFYEHGGWTHAHSLHAEAVRVPLVIRLPGVAAARVGEPVQQIDLLPTVLDALALPVPGGLAGQSVLTAALGGGTDAGARQLHSYQKVEVGRNWSAQEQELAAVTWGPWRLLEVAAGGRVDHQLFRWTEDPGETADLALERPVLAGFLAAEVARHRHLLDTGSTAEEAIIDPEMAESLRALGYIP